MVVPTAKEQEVPSPPSLGSGVSAQPAVQGIARAGVTKSTAQAELTRSGPATNSALEPQGIPSQPPSYLPPIVPRQAFSAPAMSAPPGLEKPDQTKTQTQTRKTESLSQELAAQIPQAGSCSTSEASSGLPQVAMRNQEQGGCLMGPPPRPLIVPESETITQRESMKQQVFQPVPVQLGVQASCQLPASMQTRMRIEPAASQVSKPRVAVEVLTQPSAETSPSASSRLLEIQSRGQEQVVRRFPKLAAANLVVCIPHKEPTEPVVEQKNQTGDCGVTISRQTTSSSSDNGSQEHMNKKLEVQEVSQPLCHIWQSPLQQKVECKGDILVMEGPTSRQADEGKSEQTASDSKNVTTTATADPPLSSEEGVSPPNEDEQESCICPLPDNLPIMLYKPFEMILAESLSRLTVSCASIELTSASPTTGSEESAKVTKVGKHMQETEQMRADSQDRTEQGSLSLTWAEQICTVPAIPSTTARNNWCLQTSISHAAQDASSASQSESTNACNDNFDRNQVTWENCKTQSQDKFAQREVEELKRPRRRLGWFEPRPDDRRDEATENSALQSVASNAAMIPPSEKVTDSNATPGSLISSATQTEVIPLPPTIPSADPVSSATSSRFSIVFSSANLRSSPTGSMATSNLEAGQRGRRVFEAIKKEDQTVNVQEGCLSSTTSSKLGTSAVTTKDPSTSVDACDTVSFCLTPVKPILSAITTTPAISPLQSSTSDFVESSLHILTQYLLSPLSDCLNPVLWPVTPISWKSRRAWATSRIHPSSTIATSSATSFPLRQKTLCGRKTSSLSNVYQQLGFPSTSFPATTPFPGKPACVFSCVVPSAASVMAQRDFWLAPTATSEEWFAKKPSNWEWSVCRKEFAQEVSCRHREGRERRDDDNHRHFVFDPGGGLKSSIKEVTNIEDECVMKSKDVVVECPSIRPPPEPPPMVMTSVDVRKGCG